MSRNNHNDQKHLVFVYGTLLSGEGNHPIIARSNASLLRGSQRLAPSFTMVSLGGFPALLLDGSTAPLGEVWEVDHTTYEAIERLEGYPRFYDRIKVGTKWGYADVYIIRNENYSQCDIIQDGDWKKYRGRSVT